MKANKDINGKTLKIGDVVIIHSEERSINMLGCSEYIGNVGEIKDIDGNKLPVCVMMETLRCGI